MRVVSIHDVSSQISRTRSNTSTTTLLRYISPWSAPCTTWTRQRPGPIVRSIQRTAFSAIFSSRSPYHTCTACGYAAYENPHGCWSWLRICSKSLCVPREDSACAAEISALPSAAWYALVAVILALPLNVDVGDGGALGRGEGAREIVDGRAAEL
jgi:hypothetical protein